MRVRAEAEEPRVGGADEVGCQLRAADEVQPVLDEVHHDGAAECEVDGRAERLQLPEDLHKNDFVRVGDAFYKPTKTIGLEWADCGAFLPSMGREITESRELAQSRRVFPVHCHDGDGRAGGG